MKQFSVFLKDGEVPIADHVRAVDGPSACRSVGYRLGLTLSDVRAMWFVEEDFGLYALVKKIRSLPEGKQRRLPLTGNINGGSSSSSGSSGEGSYSSISTRWSVCYDKDLDKHFIGAYSEIPIGAREIDSFWASDKTEALRKGDIIVDSHRKKMLEEESEKGKEEK